MFFSDIRPRKSRGIGRRRVLELPLPSTCERFPVHFLDGSNSKADGSWAEQLESATWESTESITVRHRLKMTSCAEVGARASPALVSIVRRGGPPSASWAVAHHHDGPSRSRQTLRRCHRDHEHPSHHELALAMDHWKGQGAVVARLALGFHTFTGGMCITNSTILLAELVLSRCSKLFSRRVSTRSGLWCRGIGSGAAPTAVDY
jgi:hypothetical protein